jgi:hypothetical protein
MLHTRLASVAAISGLILLGAAPGVAYAQFGGLVNRAKQAVHPNQGNTTVPITSGNLDAYVRGTAAEKAEEGRLDSLQTLASTTPDGARMVDVMRCQSAGAKAMENTPAQQHADSVAAARQFAQIDTVKMKQLAKAAQSGDASALAQLQAISMQMAQRQATDPAMIAVRERMMAQMKATTERSVACQKNTPPASTYVSKIKSAQSEMKQYGSRESATYTSHLDGVKLRAAGGMSPAQYAALDERIRAYVYSNTEPTQGFTQAELGVLRAHKTQLDALIK